MGIEVFVSNIDRSVYLQDPKRANDWLADKLHPIEFEVRAYFLTQAGGNQQHPGGHNYIFLRVPDHQPTANQACLSLNGVPAYFCEAGKALRADFSAGQQIQYQDAGFPEGDIPMDHDHWVDPLNRPPYLPDDSELTQLDPSTWHYFPGSSHTGCHSQAAYDLNHVLGPIPFKAQKGHPTYEGKYPVEGQDHEQEEEYQEDGHSTPDSHYTSSVDSAGYERGQPRATPDFDDLAKNFKRPSRFPKGYEHLAHVSQGLSKAYAEPRDAGRSMPRARSAYDPRPEQAPNRGQYDHKTDYARDSRDYAHHGKSGRGPSLQGAHIHIHRSPPARNDSSHHYQEHPECYGCHSVKHAGEHGTKPYCSQCGGTKADLARPCPANFRGGKGKG